LGFRGKKGCWERPKGGLLDQSGRLGFSRMGNPMEVSFEVIGACDEWLERRAHNLFKPKLAGSAQSAAELLR